MTALAPFLTGSYVYGVPNAASDVDLVIYMPLAELRDFVKFLQHAKAIGEAGSGETACQFSLKLGKINLIGVSSEEYYHAWKEGTAACLDLNTLNRRVGKAEAKEIFRKIFDDRGLEKYKGLRTETVSVKG
jgi:Nucleotidyltransferase domain